jgi:large subunit ribosomal protein L22
MAFGVKTNERPGTRAELKFARFSAYKAREVLNLIRNKSVGEAQAILQLTERGAADPILKVLNSAIANAEHNDGIAADELYVSACFADEGPTLKRFRPRARGRAGRINKRTCHITVIVSRYSPADLELAREKQARRGAAPGAAASRSRRVAGSRKSGAAAAAPAPVDEAPLDDEPNEDVLVDEVVASDAPVDEVADDVVADEVVDEVETTDDAEDTATEESATEDASEEGDK